MTKPEAYLKLGEALQALKEQADNSVKRASFAPSTRDEWLKEVMESLQDQSPDAVANYHCRYSYALCGDTAIFAVRSPDGYTHVVDAQIRREVVIAPNGKVLG